MRITIELPDDLLERSKNIARREGSNLQALIEDGLRRALGEHERVPKRRPAPATPYRMVTFAGDGRTREHPEACGDPIRGEIYRDRD